MPEAVVVATARSPIGRAFKGQLAHIRPDDLAAQVVSAALKQVGGLDPATIDDFALGAWEHSGEQGENIARRVAVRLGLDSLPATTVNRGCGSSLQTTLMAAQAIRGGFGSAYVSAGVESVSRYALQTDVGSGPEAFHDALFAAAKKRTARTAASSEPTWTDPRGGGELPDIYISMGQTAENVARLCGVTRSEQDEFALRSQALAAEAQRSGFMGREISAINLPDGTIVDVDESPRPATTLEALAALRPVFRPGGLVTAGNACPLNDGAAALVVMAADRASDLGIQPLARIVSAGVSAWSPEIMGLGPVEATRRALDMAGLRISDIDLVEINEAFAAQVIPSYRELDIELDRLNVNGGGIALGHPYGATGARITTTLLHTLRERDATFGLETMCIGGGQGMAMVFERLS
jgi:acetyl-CoA C-acetyltransferase